MVSFFKQKKIVRILFAGMGLFFTGILAVYAASVLDGDVEIDVPDYDVATGWTAGVVYDAVVRINFADTTSANKTVTITLPEGMRFTAYPVITTPASGTPGYLIDDSSAIKQFITAVTAPPKQTYYPSYNGALTYEFTSACEAIEIPFKLTVDENVYYGSKMITDGIRTQASKNGSTIGNAHMDISGVGSVSFNLTSSTWVNPTLALAGSTESVRLPIVSIYRAGALYPKPYFLKEIVQYYYYPKEVDVITATDQGAIVEINQTDGYILSKWYNRYSDRAAFQQPLVSVQNTPVGTYAAISKSFYQITVYDGTIISIPNGYAPVQVQALSSVDNKLDIAAASVDYYEYSDDHYISGPRFRIYSNQVNVKERQHIEYTIDPNYEVIQTIFFKDPTIGTIGEVQYKTNLNNSLRIALPAQITNINSSSFAISTSSLGLSENEYITYAKASIGSVSKGAQSIGNAFVYLDVSARIVGKLKDGVNSANVMVHTFALLPDNSIEPNSENSATRSVVRTTNPIASLRATSETKTMYAGEKKRMSFSLTGSTYYYSNSLALVNPTVHIRIPEYTDIDLSSISVTNNYDGVVPFTVTGPYASAISGERFINVRMEGKVGSLFELKTNYMMTISLDMIAGIEASGNYNWSEYVFWRDDIGSAYTAQNGYPGVVSDTMDVDNDGNVAEKLVPAYNYILSIYPRQEMIIDSYITPEGEDRKPPYDGTSTTAVGFTPGTTAKYTLEFLNNRTDGVNEVQAYIPVPKEGNNFGSHFQTNPFYWNMKLSGVPTVHVYDANGGDITATAAADYILSYSSDATNETNYTTATYGSTIGDDTTMIRVVNTSGVAAGQKAILSFDYVVDETIESVTAAPSKLGAINDFKPYYYFNAGTSGWQSGTAVGAMLQIGQIAGFVFEDRDVDGVYTERSDVQLSNKTVDLYKKNAGGTYVFFANTTTDAYGAYTFDGLANGVYRVDFTGAASINQEFTLKDQGGNDDIDSDAGHGGSARGLMDNIDPTNSAAKYVAAGIVDYGASNDLTVTINKAATSIKMTNAQTIFTEQLVGTIFPDFFDKIKATNGITWNSSDPTIVSVSNGLIQGARVGTATVSFSAADIYGNTKNATCMVSVTSNDVPVIQASDRTLVVGDLFDPLVDVTASDTEDGNITARVAVENNAVNNEKVGVYAVTYSVKDADGNEVHKVVSITYTASESQVETQNPSNITERSATLNARVIDTGGEDLERMIEYGTTSGAYTESCSSGTGGEGSYSCGATNLSSNTTYYYRAKTTNDAGTTYGSEIQFTTQAGASTSVTAVGTQGNIRMQGEVRMGTVE